MPKIPARTAKQMLVLLEQKGFCIDRIKGSHYVLFHPITRKTVTVPFHGGDLAIGTLLSILKFAGLTRKDL
jgi:predicted RNA binding protein YcfA (HicA-like mRNA interferase family)